MNKLRKFFELLIYIIGIALIVAIIVYLIVGYIKWGMDGLVEATKVILAQPIPIIGCSVLYGLIAILVIISKTSIGKKSLNKMNSLLTTANQSLETAKTELSNAKNELVNYASNKEKQIKEIKETYEVLLVGVKQQKDALENLVLEIGENIHNGNVEKAINSYVDEKAKVVENEISSIVETAKEEARSEYEKEIVDLKAQISELKELITNTSESV